MLRQELVPAQPEVAAALGLDADEQVMLLERLRIVDGVPLALETCHLHFPGCESLSQVDLSHQSLYNVLAQTYDLIPGQAYQQMEATICKPYPLRLLGLSRGSPCPLIRRTSLTQSGRPFSTPFRSIEGTNTFFMPSLSAERRAPHST